MQTPSLLRFAEVAGGFSDCATISDRRIRLPDWNYNVEAAWLEEIPTHGPERAIRTCADRRSRGFRRSANLNDVVGNEPGFADDHEPHCDALHLVVVAAMEPVCDSNRRAKTQ